MKMWLGRPGAATALSGDVSVFVASPIATSSIPTFGPKRVIGAKRVSSYGAQGGCGKAGAAAMMTHTRTSETESSERARMFIVSLPGARCCDVGECVIILPLGVGDLIQILPLGLGDLIQPVRSWHRS